MCIFERAAMDDKNGKFIGRVRLLRSFVASLALVAVMGAYSAVNMIYSGATLSESCPPSNFAKMSRPWANIEFNGMFSFLLHLYRTVIPKEKPHASAAWIRYIFRKKPEVRLNDKRTEKGNEVSSPLQLALLIEASSGVSQPRRVGRSCQPDSISGEDLFDRTSCEPDAADLDLDDEASAPRSCSAYDVEIRSDGALLSVTFPSRLSPPNDALERIHEDDETFSGMILQVLPAHIDQLEQERAVAKADAALVPGRVGGGKEVSSVPRICIGENYNGKQLEGLVQYELVEPISTHLGLVDVHSADYMYKPVFGLPQGVRDQINEKGAIATYGGSGQHPWRRDEVHFNDRDGIRDASQQAWRWPWLFAEKRRGKNKMKRKGDEYERMGDRAFAGGSHGEVWRARRRCPELIPSSNKKKTNNGDNADESGPNHYTRSQMKPIECDPTKELVMKRLKLEHGLDLLKAGLREVYFGELLSAEEVASSLFTKYVDHFFREVPAKEKSDSSGGKGSVELWIVFEDGGPSLRSYIYTSVESGDFCIYTHSSFWRRLRMGVATNNTAKGATAVALSTHKPLQSTRQPRQKEGEEERQKERSGSKANDRRASGSRNETIAEGRELMKEILRQILTSAAYLHSKGIVHRDIKPSNIMCKAERDPNYDPINALQREISQVKCLLGDFSSAWDEFTSRNMYGQGPSADEQTEEYAPPEVLFGHSWIPFYQERPQSYDSWSIGVVALEMLLGTPNVFSVDQRTSVVLTHKMGKRGASADEIKRALYLAALSQFCIYIPSKGDGDWPLREGEPLHGMTMAKTTCTLQDFHSALRARDPLGIGFDSSSDFVLQLIWGLLAWNPMERLTPSEALEHAYFNSQSNDVLGLNPGEHNAVESQTLDPRVDMGNVSAKVDEFVCPKCGKRYADHSSCQRHTTSRRHAKFCTYDHSNLPPCLNAHAMLPAHPTSGYCDIQGRRKTIEDFHTVHLSASHQFYGVFDGHNGNLASKYAASLFYEQLVESLADLDDDVANDPHWKDEVEMEMIDAFRDLHDGIMRAVKRSPGGVMSESGTTATVLYVTESAVVVSNVGDSRAVLSRGASFDGDVTPIQLTVDHVASNSSEKALVEGRGGFVSSAGGIDRVNGTLAVSRSLGDARLAPVLSRVPHVVAMSTDDIKAQCKRPPWPIYSVDELPCFIVLASDGLWDVMENQEVVDMVVQVVRRFDSSHGISWDDGGAFQEAAQMLTQEAFVRGSTDNIGVCVVAIV